MPQTGAKMIWSLIVNFCQNRNFPKKFHQRFDEFFDACAHGRICYKISEKNDKKKNIACNYFIFFTSSQVQTNPIFDGMYLPFLENFEARIKFYAPKLTKKPYISTL